MPKPDSFISNLTCCYHCGNSTETRRGYLFADSGIPFYCLLHKIEFNAPGNAWNDNYPDPAASRCGDFINRTSDTGLYNDRYPIREKDNHER